MFSHVFSASCAVDAAPSEYTLQYSCRHIYKRIERLPVEPVKIYGNLFMRLHLPDIQEERYRSSDEDGDILQYMSHVVRLNDSSVRHERIELIRHDTYSYSSGSTEYHSDVHCQRNRLAYFRKAFILTRAEENKIVDL